MSHNNFDNSHENKENKETEENKGQFISLSFTFIFTVLFFTEALLIGSLSLSKYYSLKDYTKAAEKTFIQRGKELARLTAASGAFGYKQKNFSPITSMLSKLENQGALRSKENPISEIFILDKQGKVLSHTDLTMITRGKKERINQIAMKYNNEFFHSGLLLEEGQVYVQDYPYPTNNINDRYTYLLQFFLSKNLNYTVDFSSPVSIKGKNYATAHVQMNRLFIYEFIKEEIKKFIKHLLFIFIAGLMVSLIIILLFFSHIKRIRKTWVDFLSVLANKNKIKGNPVVIEKKIFEQASRKPSDSENNNEILDAILLGD
ncbi:MAG: hypothetical protein OEZ13_05515 [Spirochaetia bacterium]|nr:hypothetical protein [Spirochaetia bacterium]